MADTPMQMFRLEPVTGLPGTLDAGRYAFMDAEGVVLVVDVPEPTDSRDLANTLQARAAKGGDDGA